jgi:hypothetical protein
MKRHRSILAVLTFALFATALWIGAQRLKEHEEVTLERDIGVGESSGKDDGGKTGRRGERLASQAEVLRAAAMANWSALAPNEEQPNPWRHVPGELDELLMSETEDIEATAVFRVEVEAFLVNAELDGTSVVETRCGRSICRARLVHTTEDDYLKYYRHYGLSPWAARSNYLTAQPGGDGAWGSYTWTGVAGYELPLKEIHDRHAFLGD